MPKLKVCPRPGCPTLIPRSASGCPAHPGQSPTYHARNSSWAERERRKAVVMAWVRVNGWVCPGWNRPAHASVDLTAAHVVAVSVGGANGPLTVLCRSCNSRQGVSSTPQGGG